MTTDADDPGREEVSPVARPGGFIAVRQAAFVSVGAMVGAGIFTLLGEAGAVAGSAVWISFMLAGVMAGF